MDNLIILLFIVVSLLILIICLLSFSPSQNESENVLKKNKDIFIFISFRDRLTIRITKIGFFCFVFYAFIKVYITLVSKDDPFHYTTHLLASLFEPLLASTVASFIFYLMFSGLQDRLQFKNDFIQLFSEYKEMKYVIMRIMILDQYDQCVPKNFDATVEALSQSPQKAQEYFSHEIFIKILNNLNELSTLQILRYMQSFLKH